MYHKMESSVFGDFVADIIILDYPFNPLFTHPY